MALSDKQRIAFFKLARRAYSVQQPDQEFNAWRKHEMEEAGLANSISKVSKIVGFDTLMRHFAELAYDMDLVIHYQSNEIRMLNHIINGLHKDMTYLVDRISGGTQQYTFCLKYHADAVNHIREVMQKLGQEVSSLCHDHNIKTSELPTAGSPYYLRGKRAAELAELINRKTGLDRRREQRSKVNS